MKLIIFAQLGEAQATLDLFKAQPLDNTERSLWKEGIVPTCYRFEYGHIVLSDIGLHAAAATLAHYHPGHQEIWNIGLAGTLSDSHSLFDILPIARSGKFVPFDTLDASSLQLVKSTIPLVELQQEGVQLISSDFPLHQYCIRQKLAKQGFDLIDMEGYALAHLAQRLHLPCKLWKIVSDLLRKVELK